MRSICGAAVLLSLLACRSSEDAAPSPPWMGGELRAAKAGHEVLVAAARGSYCPDDSTLALLAVGSEWVAALSLRTPWPAGGGDTLTVGTTGAGLGSARAALRPVSPEVGMALVGARGFVRLEPSATATGTFEFTAATAPSSPDSVRVTGRFIGVPVLSDLCAAR